MVESHNVDMNLKKMTTPDFCGGGEIDSDENPSH